LLIATTGTTGPNLGQVTAVARHFVADLAGQVSSIRSGRPAPAPAMRAPSASTARSSPFSASGTSGRGSRPSNARGDPPVLGRLPVFAVDRDEESRLDERQHQLQLFLAAVPGPRGRVIPS
jgi:hypothetical protein